MKANKGQLYILTAVILIAIAFSISQSRNILAPETGSTFDQLADNFKMEAPKMINNAIAEQRNATQQMMVFATSYVQYAKTRDNQFGLVYAFINDDDVFIHNIMGRSIQINYGGSFTLEQNEYIHAKRTASNIKVMVDQSTYTFTSVPDRVTVKALMRSQNKGDIRIRVLDEST